MSGFYNNSHDHHQQHRERREERHERHDRGGRHDDHDEYDNYGSRDHGQRERPRYESQDERRRPGGYDAPGLFPGQGQGRGYGGLSAIAAQRGGGGGFDRGDASFGGPPSSTRGISGIAAQRGGGGGGGGGFDRGDFASDADIDRMITSGEFDKRQGRGGRGNESEYGYGAGAGEERGSAYGRFDAPSGPPPGQGYGERASEYGRYDAPSGPPTGRGYQSQQPQQQGYGTGGYGGGPDRQNQYGSQQTQDRPQYGAPQGPPSSYGRSQGNAPSGGFAGSRDGEERFGSGYGGAPNVRSEPPHRGEAASYYGQQGPEGDRYAHLAGVAQEHGDDDPELYRRATQGLHEKIQSQANSRRPRRDDDDDDDDYKAHINAHQKAYGGDDHGPLDADTIGAAAAMEAFKQTAAAGGSSNAPAGAFQVGSGGSSSKPGRVAREEEEEEETAATRAGGSSSGGMQDKLMALAMSQAGKLFDKKNAGSSASASGGSEGKAQAMQSAAATAMELFTQYQSKGKIESGDMSKVMGLAMKLL